MNSEQYWSVREKTTDVFLGLLSFTTHHNGTDTELSYQFLPEHWGSGYTQEAAEELIRYGFGDLGLDRIVSETQEANVRSRKLLARLGMSLESTGERFGVTQTLYGLDRPQ